MIRVTVTVQDKKFKGQFIEMTIEEYIGFIRGQATMLGIAKEEGQPIYLVGFDEGSDCEGCEFSSKIDGLCDLHMDPDYEDGRNK